MHSSKDILKALGFNKEAPDSTKEAFLKQLAQAAKSVEKAEVIEPNFKNSPQESEQLSFDAQLLGVKYQVKASS